MYLFFVPFSSIRKMCIYFSVQDHITFGEWLVLKVVFSLWFNWHGSWLIPVVAFITYDYKSQILSKSGFLLCVGPRHERGGPQGVDGIAFGGCAWPPPDPPQAPPLDRLFKMSLSLTNIAPPFVIMRTQVCGKCVECEQYLKVVHIYLLSLAKEELSKGYTFRLCYCLCNMTFECGGGGGDIV